MSEFEVIAAVVMGLLPVRYAQQIGTWLQYRHLVLHPSIPLWWAGYFVFLGAFLTIHIHPRTAIVGGILLHAIVPLVLPTVSKELDTPYGYLDAYESFRKERCWIFGGVLMSQVLVVLTTLLDTIYNDRSFSTFSFILQHFFLLSIPLLLGMWIEHKGYMLLNALLAWSLLLFVVLAIYE